MERKKERKKERGKVCDFFFFFFKERIENKKCLDYVYVDCFKNISRIEPEGVRYKKKKNIYIYIC